MKTKKDVNETRKTVPIMKRITRTLVLLALLHAAGCTREDESDCLVPVSLSFALPAAAGVEGSFLASIHSVDLLLLDSAGRYLGVERLERAALEEYQGARLQLAPGRYRVTCLGNRGDNVVLEGLELLPAGGAISLAGGVDPGECDPLFRSPASAATRATTRAVPATRAALTGSEREVEGLLTIEVPRSGETSVTVPFAVAHRKTSVRVTGLAAAPVVEIAGVPAALDPVSGLGLLDPAGEPLPATARQRAIARDGVHVASFTTFPYALDDPGVVIRVVEQASSSVLYSVPLVEVIDPDDEVATINIQVVIAFMDGTVTVTITPWEETQVNPGRAGEL
jgi:hypothetical protein